MNTKIRSAIAGLLLLATLNLTVVTGRAAPTFPTISTRPPLAPATPRVVSIKTPISAQDLTKYRQSAAESKAAVNNKAAGASGNTVVWVVVGVAVVVGVVALASGGGGGGGGY